MRRPPMTMRSWRLLLASLLFAAGCGGKAGVGLVTVALDPLAPPVKQLRLILAAGGPAKTVLFPAAEGAALAFPVSVSVTYSRGVTGFLTAEVDGLSGGQVVARGGGNGALLAEGTVMVAVTLRAAGGSDGGVDGGIADGGDGDGGGGDGGLGDGGMGDLQGGDLGAVASCFDGVKNGGETDVDCGGGCLGCNFGRKCVVNGDCLWDRCNGGLCEPGGFNLTRVWGSGDKEVFAVGTNGTILRWDGGKWGAMTSGTQRDLFGLHGTSGKDVWAVGANVLAHFDGTSWDTTFTAPIGPCATRQDVWGSGPDNYLATTCNAQLIRWSGMQWAGEAAGGASQKSGLDGCAANDIWATDESQGWLYHHDGMAWQVVNNLGPPLPRYGVACLRSNDVFVVGQKGSVLHFDGNGWALEQTPVTATLREVTALGGGPGNVAAVGDSGTLLVRQRDAWRQVPTGSTQALRGAWADPLGRLWVVGDNGTILRFDLAAACVVNGQRDGGESDVDCGGLCTPCAAGKACTVATDCASGICGGGACVAPSCNDQLRNQGESDVDCGGPCALCPVGRQCRTNTDCKDACVSGVCTAIRYNRVWGSGENDVFAVGGAGIVSRWDGGAWKKLDSKTDQELQGLHGTGPTDAWAVGNGGALVHWDGNAWDASAKLPQGECAQRFDVWGSAPNNYFATGCAGTLVRWNGNQWTTVGGGGGGGDRQGIDGCSATEIWTTDSQVGYPYRWDGNAWSALAGQLPNQARYGVACVKPGEVYLVGAQGHIAHLTAMGWATEATDAKVTLREVVVGPGGPFAVGDGGTILRKVGDQWRRLPSGTMANLRGAWVSPAGVLYAVGEGSTLLRLDFAGQCKTNMMKDGVETDVDCGSYCTPCKPGGACAAGSDCDSGVCTAGKCAAPTCKDGVTNQDESDVDCGGATCTPCLINRQCQKPTDCSDFCVAGVCRQPNLQRIWGLADNALFAVGNGGVILRYDGQRWRQMASGTTKDLFGLHGTSASEVWAVGDNVLLHFDGNAWDGSTKPPQAAVFYDVWGSAPTNYQAATSGGSFIHWTGNGWVNRAAMGPQKGALTGCNSADLWAADSSVGGVYRWTGNAWNPFAPVAPGGNLPRYGAVCVGGREVYFVGDRGNVVRYDGTSWFTEASTTQAVLREIAVAPSGLLWAVGDGGVVIRRQNGVWQNVPSGTANHLHGVVVTGSGKVWAVGDNFTVLSF